MSDPQTVSDPKKDKQKQVIVKLEWIFGIRNDLCPNIYLLDKDTLIYPAGNYIVILNHPRNLGLNNVQHYIPGTPHSKGICAIATSYFSQRIVGFAEETKDFALVSFYNITGRQGIKNFPDKQSTFSLSESRINKVYSLVFSSRRKMNNYILAIASSDSSNFYFVLWKWDLEVVRDNPDIFPVKLPKTANENTKMRLSFSTASMENDQFSLVSKDFIIFYLITEKGFEETERIELSEQSDTYGSELYGHTWLFEGSFCFITDEYINILDGKYKQLIQQMENPDGELKIISP